MMSYWRLGQFRPRGLRIGGSLRRGSVLSAALAASLTALLVISHPVAAAAATAIPGAESVGGADPSDSSAGEIIDVERLLIDRDLDIQTARIIEIGDGRVVYDANGARRATSLGRLLAIVRAHDGSFEEVDPVLELVDGQRWVGRLQPSSGDGQTVAWSNDYLGTITVNLDEVRRMRLIRGSELPEITPESDGDVVHLANGDVLTGYLVALSDPILFETEGGQVSIPLERIGSLALLNPLTDDPGAISRAWTEDGSIVNIESARIENGSLSLTLPGRDQPSLAGMEYLRALVFDAGALLALAAVEPSIEIFNDDGDLGGITNDDGAGAAGEDDNRPAASAELPPGEPPQVLRPEAPLRLSDILLRGPIEVDYTLPEGASLFATRLTIPRQARGWADFTVVVSLDGAELQRWRLDREAPEWDIRLELTPGARILTIAIEQAGRGPIQDVVQLDRPRVRIDRH